MPWFPQMIRCMGLRPPRLRNACQGGFTWNGRTVRINRVSDVGLRQVSR